MPRPRVRTEGDRIGGLEVPHQTSPEFSDREERRLFRAGWDPGLGAEGSVSRMSVPGSAQPEASSGRCMWNPKEVLLLAGRDRPRSRTGGGRGFVFED